MGIPVVVVSSGGIAVTKVTDNAPVMTVATNGYGIAITKVASGGAPFIIEGDGPATLGALTLSPNTATAGVPYSATILNRTSGSTIVATSSDGTTLNVTGSTVSGTFSTAGTKTVTLTETLAGATNTPRASTPTVTVAAGASSWILATGAWNNAGVWDDAALWKDAA